MNTRPATGIQLTKLIAGSLFAIAIISPLWYRHWLATRTFIATSMPVSLSRGHIDIREFEINLPETYFVKLDFDHPLGDERCDPYQAKSFLQTSLTVFRNGKEIGQNNGQFEHYLGGTFDSIAYFDADHIGRYRLDLQVITDAGCLDQYGPRISVVAASDLYYGLRYAELSFSVVLVIAAFGFWNRSAVAQSATRIVHGDTIGLFGPECPCLRRSRFPAAKLFCTLPPFGLVFTLIVALLLTIVQIPAIVSKRSKGLWVSLVPGPHAVPILPDPALILRLERRSSNLKIKLLLNSKQILLSELSAGLRTELSRRPDWVVYLDADPDISWSDVVEVIDVVKREHRRVILQK